MIGTFWVVGRLVLDRVLRVGSGRLVGWGRLGGVMFVRVGRSVRPVRSGRTCMVVRLLRLVRSGRTVGCSVGLSGRLFGSAGTFGSDVYGSTAVEARTFGSDGLVVRSSMCLGLVA